MGIGLKQYRSEIFSRDGPDVRPTATVVSDEQNSEEHTIDVDGSHERSICVDGWHYGVIFALDRHAVCHI